LEIIPVDLIQSSIEVHVEHLLEVTAFLSDGSEVVFKALSLDDFHAKCELTTLEGAIYKSMRSMLSNYDNQVEIKKRVSKKIGGTKKYGICN